MNKLRIIKDFIYKRWLKKFRNRREVQQYQAAKLKKQLAYMEKKSPYFARRGTKDLPVMNKQFMMEHFDELNTVGVKMEQAMKIALKAERSRDFTPRCGEVSVGLSSGTSGHRGLFLSTAKEQELWAANVCAKLLPKGKIWGNRVAFFLRSDNNLYQSVNSPALEYRYFDTSLSPAGHVPILNQYQPTLLIAPPSMLVALAGYAETGELKIRPLKIISVAEILEEADKKYLQKAFAQKVIHQVYQATEGFLACTCAYGNLHINEDLVIVKKKYLDKNRFYPGITDLERTSQPMLNYELNDILVEDRRPCPCGSPFLRIKRIEGRADDIFVFYGKEGGKVRIFPDFIRRVMLFVDGIREYQVIQVRPDLLQIAANDLTEKQKQMVMDEFCRLAAENDFIPPELEFIPYQWDSKVKLKRIRRL
ncbi:CoF synthetase [Clostridiales bacterium COT073_COT-073]|nr:CoF synthetase [Clostridiales bacterium COT073_COT-073]